MVNYPHYPRKHPPCPPSSGHRRTNPVERIAIIIGAMKCGTSSLYDYLVEHEEIAPCLTKEPGFFSRQGRRLAVDAYEDLWPDYDPGRHRFVLEASTSYAKFPAETGVPERMRDYGLSPKLIYIVRNPFARIESHFQHIRHLPSERDPLDDHILNTSDYMLQIEQYLRVFPERDLLVLDFDDLVQRPEMTVARVCGFLGMTLPARRPHYEASNRTLYTRKLRARFERGPAGHLAPLIPGRIFTYADRLLARIRPEPRRTLTERERSLIHDRLKNSIRRFEASFGIPTAKWGF